MLKKILRLLKSPTPNIGKSIRNVGLTLIGAGGAGLTASTQLPEVPDSWMEFAGAITQVLSALSMLIGTILTAMGQGQVREDPDALPD